MSPVRTVGLRIADIELTLRAPEALAQRIEATWPTFVAPPRGLDIEVIDDGLADGMPQTPRVERDGDALVFGDGLLMRMRVDLSAHRATLRHRRRAADTERPGLPMGLHNGLAPLLASLCVRQGGLLLHASAVVAAGERAVVFIGPSGAGKSTIAAMYPRDAVLNDELVAVRFEASGPVVHSTPLSGTLELLPKRFTAPLGALMVLHQATEIRTHALSPRDALRQLLGAVAVPDGDREGETMALATAARLAESVPALSLEFALRPDATREAVYRALEEVTR